MYFKWPEPPKQPPTSQIMYRRIGKNSFKACQNISKISEDPAVKDMKI